MKLTCVDLFSGAGGLSLGLHAAGFTTVGAVEMAPDACGTYRKAFPSVDLVPGDARLVDFKRWKGADLVAGGPPCQPFSSGGHRKGAGDERDMIPEFVRAVNEIAPRAFLMENVPGLFTGPNRLYLTQSLAPLTGSYEIYGPFLVNSADYGVPQSRRRVMVIGVAKGGCFTLPQASVQSRVPCGNYVGVDPVGEANNSIVTYAKIPDLRPSPHHGLLFNGGGRPLDLKAPAPTILASAGGNKTHFVDTLGLVPAYHRHLLDGGDPYVGTLPGARRLTVQECALLQSFPKGMEFIGGRSSQYTQIGNAVPVALAKAMGLAVHDAILGSAIPADKAA